MKKFIFAILFLALGALVVTASPGYCAHKKSASVELSASIDHSCLEYAAEEITSPVIFNYDLKTVSVKSVEVKNCENVMSKAPVKPNKIPDSWHNRLLSDLKREEFDIRFKPSLCFTIHKPDPGLSSYNKGIMRSSSSLHIG
jgi:hypothetical protein